MLQHGANFHAPCFHIQDWVTKIPHVFNFKPKFSNIVYPHVFGAYSFFSKSIVMIQKHPLMDLIFNLNIVWNWNHVVSSLNPNFFIAMCPYSTCKATFPTRSSSKNIFEWTLFLNSRLSQFWRLVYQTIQFLLQFGVGDYMQLHWFQERLVKAEECSRLGE